MTAVVWANVLLTIPFLIAIIGIPLWITLRRQSVPDHSQAHAYLDAKAALVAADTVPVSSGARSGRRPMGRIAFGRRSAASARRGHARQATRHAGVSA